MTAADQILAALIAKPMTTVAIAGATGLLPSQVREHVRKMGDKIERVGIRHTGAVYAVRRSASAAEPRADADGGGDSPVLRGGISGMSRYLLQGGRP